MQNKNMFFWLAITLTLFSGSTYAFTVYEVTEPDGYAPFAENENILTWGENNALGEGATVSYSIATSSYSCLGGYESCISLESFMPQGYENTIAVAFDRWASVANLSFNQVDDLSGDIVWAGEFMFGWVGVELAHAGTAKDIIEIEGETFSQIAWSDIHFNELISWSIEGSSLIGYDFLTIATHEIGHALGLGHSEVVGALMYADYQGINTLQEDDIAGIQYLYGAVSAVPEPATYLQFLLGLLVLLGLTRRAKLQTYIGS